VTFVDHFSAAGQLLDDGTSYDPAGYINDRNVDIDPYRLDVDDKGELLKVVDGTEGETAVTRGSDDPTYNDGAARLSFGDGPGSASALTHQGDRAVISSFDFRITRLQGGAGTPASITLNRHGSLIVRGDGDSNLIQVYRRGRDGRIVVRVSLGGSFQPGDGDLVRSFAPKQIKRIGIFAGAGVDGVTIGHGVPRGCYIDAGRGRNAVDGGDGNDFIVSGGSSSTLHGNDGNDTITAGGGDNILTGGAGADLIYGGGGIDTINGNGGNDRLVGGTPHDFPRFDVMNGGDGFDRALVAPNDTLSGIELITNDEPA
jgi:Ca2+-binding RTX toxin-like protein